MQVHLLVCQRLNGTDLTLSHIDCMGQTGISQIMSLFALTQTAYRVSDDTAGSIAARCCQAQLQLSKL